MFITYNAFIGGCKGETAALLTYMIEHNKHHDENFHEIYHSLEAAGKTETVRHVHEAR